MQVPKGSVHAHEVEHLLDSVVSSVKHDAPRGQRLDRSDDRADSLESMKVRSAMSIMMGPPRETASAIATFMIGTVAMSSSPLR